MVSSSCVHVESEEEQKQTEVVSSAHEPLRVCQMPVRKDKHREYLPGSHTSDIIGLLVTCNSTFCFCDLYSIQRNIRCSIVIDHVKQF
jgi:hypothetical protein